MAGIILPAISFTLKLSIYSIW